MLSSSVLHAPSQTADRGHTVHSSTMKTEGTVSWQSAYILANHRKHTGLHKVTETNEHKRVQPDIERFEQIQSDIFGPKARQCQEYTLNKHTILIVNVNVDEPKNMK